MDLKTKIADYYETRARYEEAKAASDALYHEMKRGENEVVDEMLNDGTRSIGLDDGTNVSLRKSFTVSVTKDNFDSTRAWLMETTGDDSDFVEEVVSKPALLEHLKGKVESGDMLEEDVPEFLRLNTRPTVSVRGWTKRST